MANNDSYQTPSASSSDTRDNSSASAFQPEADGWHSPAQSGITMPISPLIPQKMPPPMTTA